MHRLCAIMLLSVMAFWLEAPAIAGATSQEAIPACCRRNGKHKCMMRMAEAGTNAKGQTLAPKCPFPLRFGCTAVNGPGTAVLAAVQSWFDSLASQPTAQAQAEALFRISFARSRQKRGPPVFLL